MRSLILPLVLLSSTAIEARRQIYHPIQSHEIYPSKKKTPGHIFDHITEEDVCTEGYAKKARHVSTKTKRRIKEAYGIPSNQFKYYTIDHFIPLSLGGSNDDRNLWPQSIDEKYGANQKSLSDAYLHNKVCHGEMRLEDAQSSIFDDWVSVFKDCCR